MCFENILTVFSKKFEKYLLVSVYYKICYEFEKKYNKELYLFEARKCFAVHINDNYLKKPWEISNRKFCGLHTNYNIMSNRHWPLICLLEKETHYDKEKNLPVQGYSMFETVCVTSSTEGNDVRVQTFSVPSLSF
uniref:Uncharacterized protein n=1 Tax=Sipha flava TaxID=143950 RepID=A0A2S2QGY0_9HEMI